MPSPLSGSRPDETKPASGPSSTKISTSAGKRPAAASSASQWMKPPTQAGVIGTRNLMTGSGSAHSVATTAAGVVARTTEYQPATPVTGTPSVGPGTAGSPPRPTSSVRPVASSAASTAS